MNDVRKERDEAGARLRTLAALAAKGVKVGKARSEGGGVKFATFWDSEGNALGMEQLR